MFFFLFNFFPICLLSLLVFKYLWNNRQCCSFSQEYILYSQNEGLNFPGTILTLLWWDLVSSKRSGNLKISWKLVWTVLCKYGIHPVKLLRSKVSCSLRGSCLWWKAEISFVVNRMKKEAYNWNFWMRAKHCFWIGI